MQWRPLPLPRSRKLPHLRGLSRVRSESWLPRRGLPILTGIPTLPTRHFPRRGRGRRAATGSEITPGQPLSANSVAWTRGPALEGLQCHLLGERLSAAQSLSLLGFAASSLPRPRRPLSAVMGGTHAWTMQVSRTQAPLFTPPQRGGSWGRGGGHCRAFPGVPPLRHTAQRHCPSPPPLGGSQGPRPLSPEPHPSPLHLDQDTRKVPELGNMLTSTIPKLYFSACYQITISCDISPSTMAQSPAALK